MFKHCFKQSCSDTNRTTNKWFHDNVLLAKRYFHQSPNAKSHRNTKNVHMKTKHWQTFVKGFATLRNHEHVTCVFKFRLANILSTHFAKINHNRKHFEQDVQEQFLTKYAIKKCLPNIKMTFPKGLHQKHDKIIPLRTCDHKNSSAKTRFLHMMSPSVNIFPHVNSKQIARGIFKCMFHTCFCKK